MLCVLPVFSPLPLQPVSSGAPSPPGALPCPVRKKERPGAGCNGGSHHFQGGGPRRKASGMGTHLAMMALALGGGRNEQGCCPRRGGSKCDMQTLRYARTDSHMHAQGHPGRLKDRSCWTHPHGDKGKGRLCCTGERRGVGHTHGRRTHARTHAQGHMEMLSHTGARRSLCHPHKKKSLSHACMNTGHLHAATRYKRPCHSQAHTCSHEPSHTGIIACRNSRCHSVKRPNVVTHQHMDTQCSNKYFRGSLRLCLQQNPCSQQN